MAISLSLFTVLLMGSLAEPALAADVRSVSRIEFGPDGTLFVADWKAATIHAFALGAAAADKGAQFNIRNLSTVLARTVGDSEPDIEDMAMRPGTDEAYVAVSVGSAKTPAIVVVKSDGSASPLDLNSLQSS